MGKIKMKLLELFCGTKSIANVFKEHGHEIYTIDIDKQFDPDLCIDILEFDISMLPGKFYHPNVVWASPPCTVFSVARHYDYWKNGKPKSYKTFIGLAIAKKTVEIIEQLNPRYYFIENPRGGLRNQYFMSMLPRKTVTYCQYGMRMRKATDIWTDCLNWIPKPICRPGNNCHDDERRLNSQKRGISQLPEWTKKDRVKRAIIPEELCEEILRACECEYDKQLRIDKIQT